MKTIRIVGGGLAGLSLGIALRQAGVPVTVAEAADYPRHRVCGEFLSGAGSEVFEGFGLGDTLRGAAQNETTAWFAGDKRLFAEELPEPVRGLSRFELDWRLARRFKELGGDLMARSPDRSLSGSPGTVLACGRRSTSHQWIGLKLHCRGLDISEDLTMHLGERGYVGVSRIEDGKRNVCGLFRVRKRISPGKEEILGAYLRANGLSGLARRLAAAEIDPGSFSATTALDFTAHPWPPRSVCIGDYNTSIPPFAGNGMSMAVESAEAAFPALLEYAQGEQDWSETRSLLQERLTRQFRRRLAAAKILHPLLLRPQALPSPAWQLIRLLLPFQTLYRLLR